MPVEINEVFGRSNSGMAVHVTKKYNGKLGAAPVCDGCHMFKSVLDGITDLTEEGVFRQIVSFL